MYTGLESSLVKYVSGRAGMRGESVYVSQHSKPTVSQYVPQEGRKKPSANVTDFIAVRLVLFDPLRE